MKKKNSTILSIVFILLFSSFGPIIAEQNPISSITMNPEDETSYDASSTDIDDWPMFRHDPSHTAFVDEQGPDENDVLWSTNLGCFFNTPSVANDVVYVGSYYDGGKLHAVNADNGTEIWTYSTDKIVLDAPAIVGEIVYIGSKSSHKLFALYTSNGTKKWDSVIDHGITTSPLVVNNMVYCGSGNGTIYAYNAHNGSKIWEYCTDGLGPVDSSPAYAYGMIYVGSSDDRIYALDAINGSKIWDFNTGGGISSSPSVVDGIVYVGVGYPASMIYALNAFNGSKLWEYETKDSVWSSPAVAHGMVYIGSDDYNIYALDAVTGNKIWNYTTDSSIRSSPAITNDMVYICSFGYLYALNAFNGSKIWQYQGGYRSSPAIYDGKLYVVFHQTLYAFEPDYNNTAPDIPMKPSGPSMIYTNYEWNYSTTTTDPDGDLILYKWWWGDEVSDWLGPFESGELVYEPHSWSTWGAHWVGVKAKDIHGKESGCGWSDLFLVRVAKPGDVNYDGVIDFLDILAVFNHWEETGEPGWILEDANVDGVVNVEDLLVVLANWSSDDKVDSNPSHDSCLGLTVESYVGDGWIEHGFENLTAWRIYVNFDDTSDILWAVFGSPDHPMVVTSTNGVFHNDLLYDSLWYPNNLTGSPFYYWANQWDTYVTIGDHWPMSVDPSISPGFGEQVGNFTGNFTTTNAAWFITPGNPQQGTPDEDGRVLIAQFVVAQGQHISGSLNLAYSNGEHMLDEEFSSFVPGDINGDGVVNVDDLLFVLAAWEQTGPPGWIPEDINEDGVVNVLDLLIVLANWS